ncbi:hypothetical protein U9M48_001242, partial [Paspalum notatum var. saurae]
PHKIALNKKSGLLSFGGRLVLMNSVLSSLPMFMFSFFEAPKGVLKKLDYYRSRFFCQCDKHKKKYRLAKGNILSTPKDIGGLGILNLKMQNKCLLDKWLFKLLTEDGLWQDLRKKYLHSKAITQVSKQPVDSQFWVGLMHVKEQVLSFGSFKLQNGKQIRFWEDRWVGDKPLMLTYPMLYRVAFLSVAPRSSVAPSFVGRIVVRLVSIRRRSGCYSTRLPNLRASSAGHPETLP